MDGLWFYSLWIFGSYLLGSISVGDLAARAVGVNIRTLGTGNPGAANIYREIGPAHGIAVFLLDVSKGAAATLPVYLMGFPTWTRILAMAALLAGHLFPVFWRFKGGTGMAVGMGTTVGLLPLGALVATPAAAITVLLSRNTGWAGGLFFAVALVAGGMIHRDALAATGVLLMGMAILAKSLVQYRRR